MKKTFMAIIVVVGFLWPLLAVADNTDVGQNKNYTIFPYKPSIKWDKLDFEWNCKRYKDPGKCIGYTKEVYGVRVAVVYSLNPIDNIIYDNTNNNSELGEVSGQKVTWAVGWPKELSVQKGMLFRRTGFKYIDDTNKREFYVQISVQASDNKLMSTMMDNLKTNFNIIDAP